MLDILQNTATEPIEFDDFVDRVRANVDFRDPSSIAQAHRDLGRLFLNRSFLKAHVVSGLKSGLATFEVQNKYTPPSLMLAAGNDFFVRANLWRATSTYEAMRDLNVYGLAHDHNFDFLTLNYSGPGYRSKMFTYDAKQVKGEIGERVELVDNGTLMLGEGEMFLYRKNIDVHVQYPPDQDSITINIMSSVSFADYPNQLIFDIHAGTIADVIGGIYNQKHVFDIAFALRDAECDDIMKRLAHRSRNADVRRYLSARFETA